MLKFRKLLVPFFVGKQDDSDLEIVANHWADGLKVEEKNAQSHTKLKEYMSRILCV